MVVEALPAHAVPLGMLLAGAIPAKVLQTGPSELRMTKPELVADYNSTRLEGESGIQKDGTTYYYAYGRIVDGGIEVRAEYYEYYTYTHAEVKNDGISEPLFLFGTTGTGKDIFACLAYGARFSFVLSGVM